MKNTTLLVEHLSASFFTGRGEIKAVNDVSITVPRRSIIGIVGESGCGKSMTARSIMRLLKYPGKIVGGSIRLMGKELTALTDAEMANVRGEEISMIFQEPMTSLNPVMKVGKQVQEAILLHRKITKKEAKEEVLRMFREVGISEPEKRYNCYPHELSGGLRQRIMIAMAMICRPKLLIADEPTTALDVTVEAQILELMKGLRDTVDTSIVLISHNLGVIAEVCDYVYVMYAGQIVEQADTFTLFEDPRHPYTKGLMASVKSLEDKNTVLETIHGTVPNLLELPEGCAFSPRCGEVCENCRQAQSLIEVAPNHLVRCYASKEVQHG
ncbi:MAG: ABC transporter ATP-binding protein [Oscillospiraceae bacterium]|nr:ABC transporter ATP-binding protein [Oscillospiraceae bacterium]